MNELIVKDEMILNMVDFNKLNDVVKKINQFQGIVQSQLKDGVDYGIIPNTKKPTLLKPGAEKILMLLGLRSEFEIIDSTRDFKEGFFQYQIKCRLFKREILITEGIGSCNTKESKYNYKDGCNFDNVVLKMAKKRALVDSALIVGALSDIFTQDCEDIDFSSNNNKDIMSCNKYKKVKDDICISKNQAKRMFALSKGNNDLVLEIINKYGYNNSLDVKVIDYDNICNEIEMCVQI